MSFIRPLKGLCRRGGLNYGKLADIEQEEKEAPGKFLDRLREGLRTEDPSGCGAASPSQGRWDPDPLHPALSLGGQATAWEGSPGRSLCLTI